jgi:hypothetical protein
LAISRAEVSDKGIKLSYLSFRAGHYPAAMYAVCVSMFTFRAL